MTALVAGVAGAADDTAWRDAFRAGFGRLRPNLRLHPAEATAAKTFEAAASTARAVAADSLPLAIALVMHLYPLCALRCVPLPWWSVASLRRSRLLHAIDRGALILANAGGERAAGTHAPVTISRTGDGVRVNGTYDYVSLANVADVVMFNAPLAGKECTVFCAADMRAETVCIGPAKFRGSMRMSDTCSVTFTRHFVPHDRCMVVPDEAALQCMAQYQRSWFQLLLGESYLARVAALRRIWNLPRTAEDIASLNELAYLRAYSLCLLGDAGSPKAVESLARVTAAMKLRISWHAQSTAAVLQGRDDVAAGELAYCRLQPTSDDRILRSIGAAA